MQHVELVVSVVSVVVGVSAVELGVEVSSTSCDHIFFSPQTATLSEYTIRMLGGSAGLQY
jgi:hypothetical protein